MKIVVITGSPRKNGNSFAMTEALSTKPSNGATRYAGSMPPS